MVVAMIVLVAQGTWLFLIKELIICVPTGIQNLYDTPLVSSLLQIP